MKKKKTRSRSSGTRTLPARVRALKALIHEKSYTAALPLARGLVTELPDLPELHSILALCHEGTGDDAGALDVIRDAGKKFPENTEIMVELGSLLHRVERLDESEAVFRKALEQTEPGERTKRSYSHLMLGCIAEERGLRAKAIAEWKLALEEDPGNLEAREALEVDEESEVSPDPEEERIEKLIVDGKLSEAEGLARNWAARRPDGPVYPFLRAIALWKMKKHRKAAKVLTQSLARFPDDWPVRRTLGNILHDDSNLTEAETVYREVLKNEHIPPVERAAVHCDLADVLWGLHNREEAVDQWKAALTCDPLNEEAKEALKECVNEYGEAKAPTAVFDDLYHFMNIQKERYFRLVGRVEFETKEEAEHVIAFIQNGWNNHVTPHSRELDLMKPDAKSKLFRDVTLDLAGLVTSMDRKKR